MRFSVKDGRLIRTGEWPEEMTQAQALELSIEKWKAIVEYCEKAGGAESVLDGGCVTCGLCQLYIHARCADCPVFRVAFHNCSGTPYDDWTYARTPKDALRAARAELGFLESLRPA